MEGRPALAPAVVSIRLVLLGSCDVQGLEGLAHICIQPEYSEKGSNALATFHVWGIQIKRSGPNFLALITPLLDSPIQVEEAANAATPSR